MVTHHDVQVDQLRTRHICWLRVMSGIDVGRVAVIVDIPGKVWGRCGRVVDANRVSEVGRCFRAIYTVYGCVWANKQRQHRGSIPGRPKPFRIPHY
jgi:hypothetical protein